MQKSWMKKVVVCAILVFCVETSAASAFNVNHSLNPRPGNHGNTLYVGGAGPGNYSKIQDAINNASDGDTVFVCDDSSPYQENLLVNTSVYLLGENRDTTVIDGGEVMGHDKGQCRRCQNPRIHDSTKRLACKWYRDTCEPYDGPGESFF